MASHIGSPEEDSILSFLTSDFLESQATTAVDTITFDSTLLFDTTDDQKKYADLLHPPSPPTSVGTFSESSGSPHNSHMDSSDEGSDVPMETNPLEYWQYVYSDLTQPASAASFQEAIQQQQQQLALQLQQQQQQQLQQQHQPGAWPLFPATVDAAALLQQPAIISTFPASPPSTAATLANKTIKPATGAPSSTINTPPSPTPSPSKPEKRVKRAKKTLAPAPPTLAPLAPLKPLVSLAPQPTPPSPPVSVHDTFIKQSPPLSPCISLAPAPSTNNATGAAGTPGAGGPTLLRRPSIIPALTPSMARSNPVIVKSTLIPDEKPQSEAVMTAQAKRQERLIKNRAAALLSRKRKREHISLLESHTDLLKVDNQDLKERVSELEENVKVLTEERDSARQECERLHRQITVLTHRPHETRMDMDLERNLRTTDAERGLNSKATGVVFMIILFSFALFNLPSGKLETLMVGGSLDRPRIGSNIVGRALDSYAKNPTISGQVHDASTIRRDLNMTDLVVFSDNRALQTWLGHQQVSVNSNQATANTATSKPIAAVAVGGASFDKTSALPEIVTASSSDENTKSVGFVAQTRSHPTWNHQVPQEEPDRDAWLYCTNLLYSLRTSAVSKAAGSAQATNGEIRRPRLTLISPLDGVGSSNTEKSELPPWMPNPNGPSENASEQRYLRLDWQGLERTRIRFPLMPAGVFDNTTTSLAPAQPPSATPVVSSGTGNRASAIRQGRTSRLNAHGGISKPRRTYDSREQFYRAAQAATRAAAAASDESMPLAPIKEEPMEVYIKEEPMD
ncbi:hypothetical protein BGZ95_008414 [Linnemannia exigua]|uniref:BZIP domain-containing protein n=1 Tax=Linnemannia exigua TaxID=604196 RepID=A0AAD4DEF6_9FUNG|nr:hypothetical protein BGZ95_008414 [Linnemannia exigua]